MAYREMEKFWEYKKLEEMNEEEWESLCDGCARCCMIKLENEKTGFVDYTAVVCHLLDLDSCQCTSYAKRHALVPNCVSLTAAKALDFKWLPKSCAYRRLAEGRPLANWHPLISKDGESVHRAQVSVRNKVVNETAVHEDQLQEMIVRWVDH